MIHSLVTTVGYVLEIIATWKFPHSLPCSAQHVTEGNLRQTSNFCCPENKM